MNLPHLLPFEKFLELSVDLLSIASLDGYLSWVNPAFPKALGWSADELTNTPFIEFVHPDDVDATLHEFENLLNGAAVELFENRYRTPSGEWVWLQWNSRLDQGHIFSVCRVVTEQKKAENLSRIRQRYLQMAEELAEVGHWHVDLATDTADWSAQVWRIHGLEPGDRPALEDAVNYYHPEDRPIVQEHVRRAIEEQKEFEFELRLNAADGVTRIVDSLGRPELNERGEVTGLFGVFRDVTARVNSRRELEREKRKLQQFVRVASHDLQEPLRMVASFMELLNEHYRDQLDERGQRYIAYATEGAKRMKTLVDDVLEFSRSTRQAPRLQDVSLHDVFGDILNDLALFLKDYEAEVRLPERLPTVHSDPALLRTVLQNLITNAVKFRRNGVPPVCVIRIDGGGERFSITVSDNGIGIPKNRRERIFEPFERLHHRADYEGNGIGLAIVAEAMDLLKGTLELKSVPDQGSAFTVAFR